MTNADVFESESERVTGKLRDQILDGAREPGSRLVERDLAAELGVSRVPVRDALKALVAEGLVTPRPRTWAIVREFTAEDISDLNEVRQAFEGLAFRLAAQRRTREGLTRLRAVLDVELAAARAGDAITARRAAADFHEIVTSLAANSLLTELERPLRSRMRWLLARHSDLVRVAEEHEALYQAIVDRDLVRVEELAATHVASNQNLNAATAH
ncbi:GntR family transcriptional regulator [Sinomonas sp. ASV322]|uniref:GntR family transcriptional regulator n=1 Tax=Sinomonas sp. ASV322 TaxID=3041920 RepID=UPI0027DE9E99|nr:GntR family transcriptional regulator [Sinomonas sp. ASV322]MDQ4501547.1 GntR family transcriptional regulator [Sinomonas sp. ASV322]